MNCFLLLFNEHFESVDIKNPNKTGRFTNGRSMYGVQFHRMGAAVAPLGKEDDNFYGPSAGNVWMEDITIKELV